MRVVTGFVFVVLCCWNSVACYSAEPAPEPSATDQVAAKPKRLEAEEAWEKKLESTLVIVEYNETPLNDACAHLSNMLGIAIMVDRRGLDEVGVDVSAPITLTIAQEKVPARVVLDLMMSQHGLEWVAVDGMLVITNPDEAHKKMLTRVYKVGDLLPKAPVPTPVPAAPVAAVTPRSQATNDSANAAAEMTVPSSQTKSSADILASLIQQSIDPNSWNDVGGPGSIETYGELLVVRHTVKGHREIRDLLNAMRDANPNFAAFPVESLAAPTGGDFCGGMTAKEFSVLISAANKAEK